MYYVLDLLKEQAVCFVRSLWDSDHLPVGSAQPPSTGDRTDGLAATTGLRVTGSNTLHVLSSHGKYLKKAPGQSHLGYPSLEQAEVPSLGNLNSQGSEGPGEPKGSCHCPE